MVRARRRNAPQTDPLRDIVRTHESVCYDLLGSLRALYNPRTYPMLRGWASATKKALPVDLYEAGRFFFQGHDTSVGFGAVRLLPGLPDRVEPAALISAVRQADPVVLATHMLDAAGDISREALRGFRRILGGEATRGSVTRSLAGFPPVRRRRYRQILENPEKLQSDLAMVLERYHEAWFSGQVDRLRQPLGEAVKNARTTLDVLPTPKAVEQLSGGYAISADLPLTSLTLAPSVFLYPFSSVRIDEETGDGLVIYGIPSEVSESYETVPVDPALVRALKAISDPTRLQILRLLSQQAISGPQLVERIGLAQPTVHHHLAALRAAELVRQERTRNGMLISLRDDGVRRTISALVDVFGLD